MIQSYMDKLEFTLKKYIPGVPEYMIHFEILIIFDLIYTRQKKKRNSKIFPLSFPLMQKC